MVSDYIYKRNEKIKKLLLELEFIRKLFDAIPSFTHIEEKLVRKSLLKSSLFSARIEGNRLKIVDVEYAGSFPDSKNIQKKEIFNILSLMHRIHNAEENKVVSKDLILSFHGGVMKGLSGDCGLFRNEVSAIFNQAGVAIYLTPPPQNISSMLDDLINYIITSEEETPVIAAFSHFAFEKIHPFIDGNGRVGRVLSAYILKNRGYGFHGLVSLEEYLDNNREDYYDSLNIATKDITPFIEFFLSAITVQAQKALDDLKNSSAESKEDSLLPRRREILEIVRDHKVVNFDFLHRRFVGIAQSTLHNDIKMLIKEGYLSKMGSTRGVYYGVKSIFK